MNRSRHLWDIQWFRDLVLILVVLVLLLLAYSLRAILLPIVMALALAYAFHPLISWLQYKARIPRWLSTTGLLAITSAVVLSILLWLTPQLLSQTRSLYARLPGYTKYATQQFESLQKWAAERGEDENGDASKQPASQPSSQPAIQPLDQPQSQPASKSATPPTTPSSAVPPAADPVRSPEPEGQSTDTPAPPSSNKSSDGNLTVGEVIPLINAAVQEVVGTKPDADTSSKGKPDKDSDQATDKDADQVADKDTAEASVVDSAMTAQDFDASSQDRSYFWQLGHRETGSESDAGSGQAQNPTSQPAHQRAAWSKTLSEMDFTTVGSMLVQTFNYGLGVVGVTLSLGMYLALVLALLTLGFFFFSWKFDRIIQWFDSFIPGSNRTRILHILGRMDKAISAFVRGRLLQVSIITCVLCAGWAWVGVPYWLLLGVLGGMLNIVPYAAVVAWPIAVLLMWIDTASGSSGASFTITQVFIWPSVVYIVAQSLDGWVVEPLVQGKATNLDPFSVLVAVIIGGSLLGILGTIIAVPTAACLKILLEEVVLPHVRNEIHRRDKAAVAMGHFSGSDVKSAAPAKTNGGPLGSESDKPSSSK